MFKDLVLFRPVTQLILLDNFNTDVVFYGGMDIFPSIKGNTFEFVLEGIG